MAFTVRFANVPLIVIYKEFTPSEPLRELIKCFWVLKKEYTPDDPIERVLPDSYIELI